MEDQEQYCGDPNKETSFDVLVRTVEEQQSKYHMAKGILLAINIMIDEQQKLMLSHANLSSFDKVEVLQKMIDKLNAHLS